MNHLSRLVTFAPGGALAWWGWGQLGRPGHAIGLAVLAALALVIWPVAVIAVVFVLPGALHALLIPRKLRIWHRGRIDRDCYIPKWLRRVTLAADRRRCVACGAHGRVARVEIDHYCPWRAGGVISLWNMMVLCHVCNVTKSNYWVERGGYTWYRPFPGYDDKGEAARILAIEHRRRLNPARWVRAAWALGA